MSSRNKDAPAEWRFGPHNRRPQKVTMQDLRQRHRRRKAAQLWRAVAKSWKPRGAARAAGKATASGR